ncbi:MAG: amino acid-binding protein [Actinobacteria bacterium]|nr:amino acid-binding protein [Actinomycetota bacterium]
MLFSLRISLPDRPGTLGLVASAFGRGGANILTLDVIGSEGDLAVDDLLVEAPQGLTRALLLAKEEVPGLVVEELTSHEAFHDRMSPLELATVLTETGGSPVQVLVERLPEALRAEWCAVVRGTGNGLEVLGAGIGAPQLKGVCGSWLPLDGVRRLPPADWMPSSWTMGPGSKGGLGKFELAAAPLHEPSTVVMVARRDRPQFRKSELKELELLARICAAGSRTRAISG